MGVSAVGKGRHMIGAHHELKLIPPIYVNPVVKRHENDDADDIAAPLSSPPMRTVDVKTQEQQCRSVLFRTDYLLVRQRTQYTPPDRRYTSGNSLADRKAKATRAASQGCDV